MFAMHFVFSFVVFSLCHQLVYILRPWVYWRLNVIRRYIEGEREFVCLLLVCRSSTIAFCVPFIHLSFIHLTNTKFIEYLFMLGTGDAKMTKRRNPAFKLFMIWSRPAHSLDPFHLLNHRLSGLEGTY